MAKQRKRLLIVDGYNVLRSGSRYRWQPRADEDYTDDFFNTARERLINDVANYAGRDMGAIIVFDAADNELSEGSRTKIGGVQVIFSPAGQSADKVIEKLAYDAGKRGVETMVVTSDAAIRRRRRSHERRWLLPRDGRVLRRCPAERHPEGGAQEHRRRAHPR